MCLKKKNPKSRARTWGYNGGYLAYVAKGKEEVPRVINSDDMIV